ncbi:SGNH/GDSL hydrolase family protein [Agilicoccus flavus]|uniref:SGNH/GDSL hydrolase family protein n=1 Tax=Agilicoccus flavus TaxID=2775968 RepID=UPI001CF6AE92|nr:SGNH/GDSL hydrolase family protein [Agilicoccus flavus]
MRRVLAVAAAACVGLAGATPVASAAAGLPAAPAANVPAAPGAATHQAAPPAARPAAPAPAARVRATPYLALGDSLTAGYQPVRGDDRRGGYVGVVRRGLAGRGTPVTSTNLGCTGETTATFTHGGRCGYARGSQLRQAEAFLRRHPSTSLVTLSLGANDLNACRTGTQVRLRCALSAADTAGDRLDAALTRLRRVTPRTRIVVLEYYNPYLALRLSEPRRRAASVNSTLGQNRLNAEIRSAAVRHGAKIARVSTAYRSYDLRSTSIPGRGRAPRNVATICSWTWMCSRADIHPNTTGYGVIGRTVLARL